MFSLFSWTKIGSQLEELGFILFLGSLFGIAWENISGVSAVLVEFFNSLFNEGSQFGEEINFLSSCTSAVWVFSVEGVAHIWGKVEEILISNSFAGGWVDDVFFFGDAGLHGWDVGGQLSLDVD